MKTKYYELNLPVWKKGDDLNGELEEAKNDNAKALLGLADRYSEAARMCKIAAGAAKEGDLLITQADCHFIGIEGNEARLEALEKDGILWSYEDEFADDEFEDELTDEELANMVDDVFDNLEDTSKTEGE